MSTTVTTKGQVTIPKDVRDRLGLIPGSKVRFQQNSDGDYILLPADESDGRGRFARWRGHAGPGLDTDSIMRLTRGEPGE
ncbi:MAG: AbrB/MazE/SpoVT family DNA-binding domain-containing protein [Mesorhizobium sp.]